MGTLIPGLLSLAADSSPASVQLIGNPAVALLCSEQWPMYYPEYPCYRTEKGTALPSSWGSWSLPVSLI